MSDWFGGKPGGCISITNGSYQVSFCIGGRNERKYITRCFSNAVDHVAKKAAQEWQYEKSLELGLTKNQIRVNDDDPDDPYLEVQMQNGMIMLCDCDDVEAVENSIWTAWKGVGRKCWYAKRRKSIKRNQSYVRFHNLIAPQYTQVDHINRNGLDNRRQNLREGGSGVNAKNKSVQINSTTGITGVHHYQGVWSAQIGTGSTRRRKVFSVKKYGAEEAKLLAIKQRRAWEKELKYGANIPIQEKL